MVSKCSWGDCRRDGLASTRVSAAYVVTNAILTPHHIGAIYAATFALIFQISPGLDAKRGSLD